MENKSYKPAPLKLGTERLTLRQAVAGDEVAVVDYLVANREFYRPFEPLRPREFYTQAFWEQAIQADHLRLNQDQGVRLFLFPLEQHSPVLGFVNLSNLVRGAFQAAHLGYGLDQNHQGQGLMTEALTTLIDFAFGPLNLHRLMANTLTDNARSTKLLEKLGFVREGIAPDYLYIEGKWQDHVLTSLVNPRWRTEDAS